MRLRPLLLLLGFLSDGTASGLGAARMPDATFRVGISHGILPEINENDARAAMKVWGRSITRERGIPIEADPLLFRNGEELRRALEDRAVDCVAIQTTEYAGLPRRDVFGPAFIMRNAGRVRERYVLLAHRDAAVTSLTSLRGRSLNLNQNSRLCLAEAWLGMRVAESGLGSLTSFMNRISRQARISKAVLPVFFRQVDACVVTESGFETMSELNPQVGLQLRVIERSPEFVPTVICFRADYAPAFRDAIFDALRGLHESAAGQQVLTIFECERIVDAPADWADSALELLAKHTVPASGTEPANAADPGGAR